MDASQPVAYEIAPGRICINLHPGKYPILSRLFYLFVFLVTMAILFFGVGRGLRLKTKLFGYAGMIGIACYSFFRAVSGHAKVRMDGRKRMARMHSWPVPPIPFDAFSGIELLQSRDCRYLYHYALLKNDSASMSAPVPISADFFPLRPEQPDVANKLIPAVLRLLFESRVGAEELDELTWRAHIPQPELAVPPERIGDGEDWDPQVLFYYLLEERSYRESADKRIVLENGNVVFRKHGTSPERLAMFVLAFGVFSILSIIGARYAATSYATAPIVAGAIVSLAGGLWCWRRYSVSRVVFDMEKRRIFDGDARDGIPFSSVTGVKRLKHANGSYYYGLCTENGDIALTPRYARGKASPRYVRAVAIPALRRLFSLQEREQVDNERQP